MNILNEVRRMANAALNASGVDPNEECDACGYLLTDQHEGCSDCLIYKLLIAQLKVILG